MKKKITFLRLLPVLLMAGLLLGSGSLYATVWTYDFGTGTGTHPTNTASTTFLTSTPTNGGTYRVRTGAAGGTMILANPGTTLGTGTELQINAATSTSSNKFGVYDWTTPSTVSYVKYKYRTTSTGNGNLNLSLGINTVASDNQGYTSHYNNSIASLTITYASGAISSVVRRVSGSNTTITSSGITKDGDQIIEIYANNGSTSVNYTKGGSNTLATKTWDLWIDGTKIVSNAATAGSLAAGTSLSGFAFFAESSTTNAAFVYLDDIEYANALPLEVSAPSTQANNLTFGSIDQTSMTTNWTNGNGAKRVVIMNTSNSFTTPADGTDPTANTVYGGSGQQVVYNNSSNSVAVTGLSASTTYWYRVYEYNGSGATTKFFADAAANNPNSQATSAPAPLITVNPATLTSFTYVQGSGPSAEQSFTVNGANLTNELSIAASTNYEISKSSGSGYATPLTYTIGEAATDKTIYVRLKAGLSTASYNSEVINITSTGATAKTVTCSGSVTAPPTPEPSNHATTFTATANSSSQITVNWTDATGGQVPDGYLVIASTGTPTAPVDGTAQADATLVKNIVQGGAHSAVFTGLSASTTYNFSIWPYTNSGATIDYKIGSQPTANATTLALPWTEDFETGTKASYVAGDITCTKGSWNISEALIGTSASDRKNGSQSVRLRYTSLTVFGELKMNFDKNGAGTITVNHAKYGTDADGSWKLQMSINGGTDWTDVGSTVNTTSTTLTAQNYTINQSGNVRFKIIQLSGNRINIDDITITDYVAPATSTWSGTISTDWNLGLNWNNGTPSNTTSITIDDVTNDPIINNTIESSSITLNSGSVLTINASKQLTVTGTLTNNGIINLLSSPSGTATLKAPASISGSGSYTVQQYLTNQSWYLTSPLSNNPITPTNLSRIQSYIEGSGTGNVWSASGTTMVPLKGYITSVTSAPNTVEFTGTINTGNISIPLTRQAAGNENKYGFNLIGNPYTAYLDWNAVATANAAKMPTATMWYRTRVSGGWAFTTVNGMVASPDNASYLIPPMQAFWVRASGTGNTTLDLTNNMVLQDNNTSNKLKAPAAANTDRQMVRLQVSNSTNTDELVIYTDASALNSFDTYDSPKMSNESADIPEISSIVGSEYLVINGLNSLMLDTALPIRFVTKTANTFTFKANQVSNLPEGVKVMLSDNGTEYDLTNGAEYDFSSDVADNTNRFSIIFRSAGTTTGLTGSKLNTSTSVFVNANGELVVKTSAPLSANATVSIYNAIGQQIGLQTLTSSMSISNVARTAGVYWVKLNNDGEVVTRKVVVK